jgi:hypothetical protein
VALTSDRLSDLEFLYADAAARLPTSHDYDAALEAGQPHFARAVFDRGSLPGPPTDLTSARVCIAAGSHGYDALSVDLIDISAQRETYRALGLFILASLLAPGPNRFVLRLTHPASQVRRLVVDTMYRQLNDGSGLRTEASGAVYFPMRRQRLVAEDRFIPGDELPHVFLTDVEEMVGRDWPGDPVRDTVVGFASDRGAYTLAELLLDVSQAWNEEVEYVLEGPYGFGGVAPTSAEIRLWLPGSFGWNESDWTTDIGDAAG